MAGYHNVRPYVRSDGTPVRGHRRRNPSHPIGIGGVLLVCLILALLGGAMNSHAQGRSHTGTPAVQQSHTDSDTP